MHVIVDVCVVPIGVGVSLSAYVAACGEVIEEAGLKQVPGPNGTAIEGEWDTVFTAVKACHDRVHKMGAPRVHTTVKVGTRIDRLQTIEDKLASVEVLREGEL
ncbi:MAG: MTH1187 family thiamine-binding protein [Pontiellaceae bacterium]